MIWKPKPPDSEDIEFDQEMKRLIVNIEYVCLSIKLTSFKITTKVLLN